MSNTEEILSELKEKILQQHDEIYHAGSIGALAAIRNAAKVFPPDTQLRMSDLVDMCEEYIETIKKLSEKSSSP